MGSLRILVQNVFQFHTNIKGLLYSGEGVTFFKGTGGQVGGSSLLIRQFFLLCLCVVQKSKQNRLRGNLGKKLIVCVFVKETIWTSRMNGNLHEPTGKYLQTCPTSDQPHCLVKCRSFCAWFVSRIQKVCQPTNISKGYPGKGCLGSLGRRLYLLHSCICFMHWDDTKKSRIGDYFLPTSPPVPRLNWTHIWSSGKIWECV